MYDVCFPYAEKSASPSSGISCNLQLCKDMSGTVRRGAQRCLPFLMTAGIGQPGCRMPERIAETVLLRETDDEKTGAE